MPKLLNLLIMSIVLTACGGGSGSAPDTPNLTPFQNASNQSLSQLESYSQKLQADAYTGITSQATLTTSNSSDLLSLILYEMEVDTGSSTSNIKLIEKSVAMAVESTKRAAKSIEKITRNGSSNKIAVDETDACDNTDGNIQLSGSLNDDGTGALAVTYNNCVISDNDFGTTIINGAGAIYFHDGSGNNSTLFYEQVTLSGDIDGRLVGHSRLEYGLQTANLVLQDNAINFTYRLSNWELRQASTSAANGRFYHPDFGFVDADIVFNPTFIDVFSVVLLGAGASQAKISTNDGLISLTIDEDGDGTDDKHSYVYLNDFSFTNKTSLFYTSIADINQPPTYDGISIISYGDTTEPVEATLYNLVDPENQFLEIIYVWTINGVVVDGQSTSILPPYIAKKDDLVGVSAIIIDQDIRFSTGENFTNIYDANGKLTIISDTGNRIPGEHVIIDLVWEDADEEDLTTGFTVQSMPIGMQLNGNQITWQTPKNTLPVQNYFFDILHENLFEAQQHTVRVVDPSIATPSVTYPTSYSDHRDKLLFGQFDNDTDLELVGLGGNAVEIYDYNNKQLVKQWSLAYPAGNSDIRDIQLYDEDMDGIDEIYLASGNTIYKVDQNTHIATAFYTAENEYDHIYSFAFTPITQGSTVKLLLSFSNQIAIVDLNSKEELRLDAPNFSSAKFLVGNVDNDASVEMIYSNGQVIDAQSGLLEWEKSSGFGNAIVLVDVDGDGISEIFGTAGEDVPTLFDANNKAVLWSNTSLRSCGISAANVVGDTSLELIVAECEYDILNSSVKETLHILSANKVASTELFHVENLNSESNFSSTPFLAKDINNDGSVEIVSINTNSNISLRSITETLINSTATVSDYAYRHTIIGGLSRNNTTKSYFAAQTFDGSKLITHSKNDMSRELFLPNVLVNDGILINADNDTALEIVLIGDNYPDGVLHVFDLSTLSIENSLALTGQYGSRDLIRIDVNLDQIDDLVFRLGSTQVQVFDIVNQLVIWESPLLDFIYDIEVVDFLGDQTPEIVIATNGGLLIWQFDDSSNAYHQIASTDVTCEDIEIGDILPAVGSEIFCTNQSYFGEAFIYDSALNLQATHRFDFGLRDILLDTNEAGAADNMFVATSGNKIAYISINNAKTLWKSNWLWGSASEDQLQFYKNSAGENTLIMGSQNALYTFY